MRPELEIVQPDAVRVTVICSLPTGTPRTKIVKLDEAGSGAAGAGVCADRRRSAPARAAASAPARIE